MKNRRNLLFVVFLCAVFAGGCSVLSSSQNTTKMEGGDLQKEYSTSLSFQRKSPENMLNMAKSSNSTGQYDKALEILRQVAAANPETKFSDEAYFLAGSIYANLLNPKKNLITAKSYFTKVITNKPESDFDAKAQAEIKRIETFLKK